MAANIVMEIDSTMNHVIPTVVRKVMTFEINSVGKQLVLLKLRKV
jgi:hypothetical protein